VVRRIKRSPKDRPREVQSSAPLVNDRSTDAPRRPRMRGRLLITVAWGGKKSDKKSVGIIYKARQGMGRRHRQSRSNQWWGASPDDLPHSRGDMRKRLSLANKPPGGAWRPGRRGKAGEEEGQYGFKSKEESDVRLQIKLGAESLAIKPATRAPAWQLGGGDEEGETAQDENGKSRKSGSRDDDD